MTTPLPSTEFLALQRAVAGRYSLERELGRGGMGIVFLARDVALDRPVAIKLLPPTLGVVPELRERFLREARTAAKLSHPNIVPIHLVEERDDLVYFVMGFIEGESLGQLIRRRGALPPSRVGRIVQEVAWALAHAHQLGVIHRDIKPDNILLDARSERAVVTDFGIARVAEAGTMSNQGEVVGTAHYMSPEQATGEAVDGRSDLYSLGVTSFYALTGKLPFEGQNLPALIHQHVTVPAPRVALTAPMTPLWLAETVDRCLAKRPDDRFSAAEDLAVAAGAGVLPRREVPPEIRALLRRMYEGGLMMAAGLTGVAILLGPGSLLLASILEQITWDNALFPALVLAFLALRVPVSLVIMARRGITNGLGFSDVHTALLDEGRLRIEEANLAGSKKAEAQREKRETLIRRTWMFLLAGSALTTAVYFFPGRGILPGGDWLLAGMLTLLSGGILVGAGPAVPAESPLRGLNLWQRMLVGRFGKALYWLAGLGLRRQDSRIPSNEQTEVVLAAAVDALFERLPKEVKARVPALPKAIARLEADAMSLRKREAAISRAIAEAAPDAAPRDAMAGRRRQAAEDLEMARTRVRERLEQAVAALESIRLDLLRLQAGVGSPDELTADLKAAEEINRAVNEELSGRGEVDRHLKS